MIAFIRDPARKKPEPAELPTDYLQIVNWLNDMYDLRHKYMEDGVSQSVIDEHDDFVFETMREEREERYKRFPDRFMISSQLLPVPGSPVSHTLLWSIAGPRYTDERMIAKASRNGGEPRPWLVRGRTPFHPLNDLVADPLAGFVPHAPDRIVFYYNPSFAADLCTMLDSLGRPNPNLTIFTHKDVKNG